MVQVDFSSWVAPDLELTLGGHTYRVRPPSVDRARAITACAARAELALGLVDGTLPDSLLAELERLDDTPLGVITLGQDVYDQMVADDVPVLDLDRAAYYALWFWARGKGMADWLADTLWTGGNDDGERVPAGPKVSTRPTRPRGRRTASASPTPTAGTPTTGSPTT